MTLPDLLAPRAKAQRRESRVLPEDASEDEIAAFHARWTLIPRAIETTSYSNIERRSATAAVDTALRGA